MITSVSSTRNLSAENSSCTVLIHDDSSYQKREFSRAPAITSITTSATVPAESPSIDDEFFNQKAEVIQRCFRVYLKKLPEIRETRIQGVQARLPVVAGLKRKLNFPFEIGLNYRLKSLEYVKKIVRIFQSEGLRSQIKRASERDGKIFAENWLEFGTYNLEDLSKSEEELLFKYRKLFGRITRDFRKIASLSKAFISFFCEQRQCYVSNKDSVVVVTSTGGNGHKSAAYALAQTLLQNHGIEASVWLTESGKDPLVDLLGHKVRFSEIWNVYSYGKGDQETAGKLYRLADSFRPYMPFDDLENLVTLLRTKKAGAIIVNHPKDALLAATAAKIVGIPVIASSTDVGRDPTRAYGSRFQIYLSSEQEYGIFGSVGPSAKAPKYGVPPVCRPGFRRFTVDEKNQEKLIKGISIDTPYFLMTSGGLGSLKLVQDLDYLLLQDDDFYAHPIVIKVICGKNSDVKSAVESLLTSKSHPQIEVRVAGFQDHNAMISDFKAADYMIGKPGGSTSAECFAAGLPLLANDCLGGEQGNLNFLISKKLGVDARGNAAFIRAVTNAIRIFQSEDLVEIAPYDPWSNAFVKALHTVQETYRKWDIARDTCKIEKELVNALYSNNFAEVERLVKVEENRKIFLDRFVTLDYTRQVNRSMFERNRVGIPPRIWMFFLKKMNLKKEEVRDLSDITRAYIYIINRDIKALGHSLNLSLPYGRKEDSLKISIAASFIKDGRSLLAQAIDASNTIYSKERAQERGLVSNMFLAMMKRDTEQYRKLLPTLLLDTEEESFEEVFRLALGTFNHTHLALLFNQLEKTDLDSLFKVYKKLMGIYWIPSIWNVYFRDLKTSSSSVNKEFFIENIDLILSGFSYNELMELLEKMTGKFSLEDIQSLVENHSYFTYGSKVQFSRLFELIFSHVAFDENIMSCDWIKQIFKNKSKSRASFLYYSSFLRAIPIEVLNRDVNGLASLRGEDELFRKRVFTIPEEAYAKVINDAQYRVKLNSLEYTRLQKNLNAGLVHVEYITETTFTQMAKKGLLDFSNLELAMDKLVGFSNSQYMTHFLEIIQIIDPALMETFIAKLIALHKSGTINLQKILVPHAFALLMESDLDFASIKLLAKTTRSQMIDVLSLRIAMSNKIEESRLLELLDIADVNMDVLYDAIQYGYSREVIQKIISQNEPYFFAGDYQTIKDRGMFDLNPRIIEIAARSSQKGVLEVILQDNLAKCKILAENREQFYHPTRDEKVELSSDDASSKSIKMINIYYLELDKLAEVVTATA